MKKNIATFVFAVIGTILMYFITTVVIEFLAEILSQEASESVVTMFVEMYMNVTYVFCVLNLLFGFWGIFKKGGCTALKVFSILLLVLGGFIIYLIPCIFNLIGASIGKKRFMKHKIEQEVRSELNA